MLTYKELQKILGKYNLSVSRETCYYLICDLDNVAIANVNRDNKAKFETSFAFSDYAKDWSEYALQDIVTAISQFACSPIDERDIQQRYFLKDLDSGNFLKRIPTPRGGYTTTRYTDEKDVFIEEEAEELIAKDFCNLEKIKVRDDYDGLTLKWIKLYMVTADTYDGDYNDYGSEICFFGVYEREERAKERVEELKKLGHRYAGYREVRLNADEWQFLGGYIDD